MFVIAAVTMAMIAILSAFNGIEDLVQDLFGTLDADLAAIPLTGETLPNELGEIINHHLKFFLRKTGVVTRTSSGNDGLHG